MGSLFNILSQYRGSALYDLPRFIFSSLDSGIYWLISKVYGLIEDLAHVSIFSPGTLQGFYSKVYALLSIFMLFKISFSIISYILDPAKMVDKTSGFGKMFVNVIVMFAMILSAPVAFQYLTKLQNAILDEDVIPNFIFGEEGETASGSVLYGDSAICQAWYEADRTDLGSASGEKHFLQTRDKGDYIALITYRTFYQLTDPRELPALGNEVGDNEGSNREHLDEAAVICNGSNSYYDVPKITNFINATVNRQGKNDYYIIEYRWFVGTAIGVYVALMLISIAFDVAVRAIKLGFLQLIAPIPIISYIDPKSGKSGIFSKYMKELGSTWASLFVRLFAVFFAVFVISEVDIRLPQGYEQNSSNFFITLFVIIGALMFAKQLPKLIEDLIPGLKLGKMQLNPFKKISEEALGGKQLVGAAGAAVGFGVGAVSRIGNLSIRKVRDMKDSEKRKDRLNNTKNSVGEKQRRQLEKVKNQYNKGKIDQAEAADRAHKINEKAVDQRSKISNKIHQIDRRAEKKEENKEKWKKRFASPFGRKVVGAKNIALGGWSIVSTGLSGANEGYKEGKSGKYNLFRTGIKAAKVRNYKDEYNIADRFREKATDFFGVKNESGTTSLIANEIKQLNKDLTRAVSNYNNYNRALGELIANRDSKIQYMIKYDENKRPIMVDFETAKKSGVEREQYEYVQNIVNNVNYFDEEQNEIKKKISKAEKTKDMPGQFKPKD